MSAYLKARPVPVRSFNFEKTYITLDIGSLLLVCYNRIYGQTGMVRNSFQNETKDYVFIPEIEEMKSLQET